MRIAFESRQEARFAGRVRDTSQRNHNVLTEPIRASLSKPSEESIPGAFIDRRSADAFEDAAEDTSCQSSTGQAPDFLFSLFDLVATLVDRIQDR